MAQRYLIQFSIDYDDFLLAWNQLCGVHNNSSELTHSNSGFLWADFEQRYHIDRAINESQNDCGAVSTPKDCIRTRVVTFDTAKHFIIPIETPFV